MTAADYLPILALWTVGMISPGPDAALVSREVLLGGRAKGIEAALGIASGIAVWVLVASVAGAALADGGGRPVAALEAAGGAYLVYLGLGAVAARRAEARNAHAPALDGEVAGPIEVPRRRLPAGSFAAGLITNLLNPKALLFFAAIFTALVPADATDADRAVLGVTFVVTEAAWFSGFAVAVSRVTEGASSARWRRRIGLVTEVLFLALGTVAIARGLQGLA